MSWRANTNQAQRPHRLHAAIMLGLSTLCLVGCGGGPSGVVRVADAPPALAPPPPPRSAPAQLVIDVPAGTHRNEPNGLPTAGTLIKNGLGDLYLSGESTYTESVQINEGYLGLLGSLQTGFLNSEVYVNASGHFGLDGTVRGSVFNRGVMSIWNPHPIEAYGHPRIMGNYWQSSAGTLWVHLGADLQVAGNVTLEGGTLRIGLPAGGAGAPAYSLTPQILQATGTISGAFDRVVLPSVFLSGTVNYGAHDISMNLVQLSAASVIANASVGDATTRASAANLDAAFAQAGTLRQMPSGSLSAGQQQFLASATAVWSIRDVAQAVSSIDSLSGQGYASARNALFSELDSQPQDIANRLGRIQDGAAPGAWVDSDAGAAAVSQPGMLQASVIEHRDYAGFDYAFSPNFVVGIAGGQGLSLIEFDRQGGQARLKSPAAMAYAHYWRGPWYTSGQLSQTGTTMTLQRTIDLGPGGIHPASSELALDRFAVHLEAGRQVMLGRGRFNPYAGLVHESVHSDAFDELGSTGFELRGQAATVKRTATTLGLRYQRDWRWGDDGWARVKLGGSYRRTLQAGSGGIRAAFTGAPQQEFDIAGMAPGREARWLSMNFAFGDGDDWSGVARFDRSVTGNDRNSAWWLGGEWRF